MRAVPSLFAALILALPIAAQAETDCTLAWHSTIPVLMRDGHATVPVQLEGQVVGMMIDTGAADSMITPQAAAQLGLRPIKDYPRTAMVGGVDGGAFFEIDQIHTMVLGGVTYRNIAVWQSALNGRLGRPNEEPVAGIIGADLLAHYDVALDEPGSTLMLYTAPGGCGRIPPPDAAANPTRWTNVPFELGEGDALLVQVMVNGQPIRAMLDTGAGGTLLTPTAARTLGLPTAGSALHIGGIGAGTLTGTRQHAATLALGGVTLHDVPLLVATNDIPVLRGADMLLGASLLTRTPVLISYRSHTIWLKAP